jgi:hypothetical protein
MIWMVTPPGPQGLRRIALRDLEAKPARRDTTVAPGSEDAARRNVDAARPI